MQTQTSTGRTSLFWAVIATLGVSISALNAEEASQTPPQSTPPPRTAASPAMMTGHPMMPMQEHMQQKMQEHFKETDKNGDGKVTREEAMQRAAEHFNEVDSNKDGVITMDEVQAHHQQKMQKMHQMMQGQGAPGPAGGNPHAGMQH